MRALSRSFLDSHSDVSSLYIRSDKRDDSGNVKQNQATQIIIDWILMVT